MLLHRKWKEAKTKSRETSEAAFCNLGKIGGRGEKGWNWDIH